MTVCISFKINLHFNTCWSSCSSYLHSGVDGAISLRLTTSWPSGFCGAQETENNMSFYSFKSNKTPDLYTCKWCLLETQQTVCILAASVSSQLFIRRTPEQSNEVTYRVFMQMFASSMSPQMWIVKLTSSSSVRPSRQEIPVADDAVMVGNQAGGSHQFTAGCWLTYETMVQALWRTSHAAGVFLS